MSDELKKEAMQASQCFMCTKFPGIGCLECRTHRLLSDIRSGLYEKMGVEQARDEWAERAERAEERLAALSLENEKMAEKVARQEEEIAVPRTKVEDWHRVADDRSKELIHLTAELAQAKADADKWREFTAAVLSIRADRTRTPLEDRIRNLAAEVAVQFLGATMTDEKTHELADELEKWTENLLRVELAHHKDTEAELRGTLARERNATKGLFDAAKALVGQFKAIEEHQRKLLIEGQTLETAAENWDAATLGHSLNFGPLLATLSTYTRSLKGENNG